MEETPRKLRNTTAEKPTLEPGQTLNSTHRTKEPKSDAPTEDKRMAIQMFIYSKPFREPNSQSVPTSSVSSTSISIGGLSLSGVSSTKL